MHRFLWTLLALLLLPAFAGAAPGLLPLSGWLADDLGVPLNGPASLTVTLYASETATTSLYADTVSIDADEGFFTAYAGSGLGGTIDLALFAENEDLWVGLSVNGAAELTPRLQVAPTPWAGYAEYAGEAEVAGLADDALALGGVAASGYMTTGSEADPVYGASAAAGVTSTDISNWDTAYGWGDHSGAGYVTTEADPVFGASPAAGLTTADIAIWDAAYGWGDHASAGYLTAPVTSGQIANDAITSAHIASGAVGSSEIAANAVGSSQIAANAVGGSEIATNAVNSSEIAAGAVDSSELDDSISMGSTTSSGWMQFFKNGVANRVVYIGYGTNPDVGSINTYYGTSNTKATTLSFVSSSGNALLGVNANDGSTCCDGGMYIDTFNNAVVYGDQKSFIMDHPTDPDSKIMYTAVEGPEAAAYVRGTGTLVDGVAVIELADHFGMVASAKGMTATVTPASAYSLGLAVTTVTPTYIVVEELNGGAGNYDFHYKVEAVRQGFEDYRVIRPNSEFEAAAAPLVVDE